LSTKPGRWLSADGLRLLVALSFVAIASFIAAGVQSSWGRVQVRSILLPTENGQWLAADLFKPHSATRENPAPLVVVVPGFQRSKEALSNVSIELSRRGAVVIAIDPYAQGGSSSSLSRRAATTEGYGLFAVVRYAHDTPNLNYIDRDRIAATGHSAGGNAAILAASHFGRMASRTGEPSKLHSVFVSGYVLSFTDRVLRTVRCNVGASYALYDEGAFRNEQRSGDMRQAPEALRLVNSGLSAEAAVGEVEIGRYYGDEDAGSLRVVHNEPLIHPLQPYDTGATANQLAYFERVLDLKSGLASDVQVWWIKELATLVATVAAFAAILPAAGLLLRLPCFAGLSQGVPPAAKAPRGATRLFFWGAFGVSALVACVTFVPLSTLSQTLFVAASGRETTWFFPQRMNNAVMLWAVVNGLIGLAVLGVSRLAFKQPGDDLVASWGLGARPADLAKQLLLAASLATGFFGVLFAVYSVLHVDYRFVFFGARVFQPSTLVLLAMYAPFFFVFFFANSLRVNAAMRFEGELAWRSLLLAAVGNSLGLFLILVVQYTTLAATGSVLWKDGWLYVNLLFAIAPIMFALPYFHRWFFLRTGRVYLGPMTMCLIFVTILLSNTVCYLPL
jgi:CTP:molybdopterin cytidylyltransferase MocA